MVAVQQVREAGVFCMGCGAEVPPRAAVCPVCGRDTARGGELPAAPAVEAYDGAADASAMHSRPLERAAPPVPVPISAPAPLLAAGPSIGSGDLDQPGFPRDALGRSLIFTVLAMVADLLAPWVNLGGSRVAPSSLGLPALLGVAWLGLAVLPLLRPSLRATPLYAAAPLVVGATSLGLGAVVWLRVTLLGAQTVVSGAEGAAFQETGATNSADVGLYLFLAGAIVLVVAGYQLLLAAAHAQALAELRAEAAQQAPAGVVRAFDAAATQQSGTSGGQPATAAYAATPDTGPTPTAAAPGSRPLPLPPAPAPGAHQQAPAPARQGVALPGSAAWNQTPHTPDFQRPSPSLGWRRRGP